MKQLLVLFVVLLPMMSAHAEALTTGAKGSNEEEACSLAKEKVKSMIEEKGATAGKFSNCDCTNKNTMVVVCKVTGYFSSEGKPSGESK